MTMTKQIKKDRHGILVNSKGYVAYLGCQKNHSGNTGMVHHSGEWYECQGCGNFVGAGHVREQQDAARARGANV